MKYLCLIYSDEKVLHDSPDSPRDGECYDYFQSVQQSGRMLAAEPGQWLSAARGGDYLRNAGPGPVCFRLSGCGIFSL